MNVTGKPFDYMGSGRTTDIRPVWRLIEPGTVEHAEWLKRFDQVYSGKSAWDNNDDRKELLMLTVHDLCLLAIAVALWVYVLFGTNLIS